MKTKSRTGRQYNPEAQARRDAKSRERHLQQNYGLSTDGYNNMFICQGGCCAICGTHQSQYKQALFVDHNHKTGQVRELLCPRCNYIVGWLEDDMADFAAAYIKAHA